MEQSSELQNASSDAEPSLGKAFVIGIFRISIAVTAFWGIGKLIVKYAHSVDFVSTMLETYGGRPDGLFFVVMGAIGTLAGLLFALLAGCALMLLFLLIVQIGGKEVFPR